VATVTAVSASGNAVTYTISAPSGTWGASPQGTYTVGLVGNQVKDVAGNAVAANSSLATFVVNTVGSDAPPQVVGVYLSGSTWKPAYFSALAAAGVGSATLGFELADGAGQLANVNILGSVTANMVTIVFSKPVNVASGSLVLEDSSSNDGPASGITVINPPVPTSTTTVTWTLSGPLTSNKYYLALAAAGVTDAVGTELDGDWTTGVSTYAAGSGNGVAGGNFDFKFYLLAGDVNGDGKVAGQDASLDYNYQGLPLDNATNWRYDLNGDGKINGADASASFNQPGVALRTFPEPVEPDSNLVPGGSEIGNTSSVVNTTESLAATTNVLAAAATNVVAATVPTVAIATPAAAVQDSSATPSNTVAAAVTVFESNSAASAAGSMPAMNSVGSLASLANTSAHATAASTSTVPAVVPLKAVPHVAPGRVLFRVTAASPIAAKCATTPLPEPAMTTSSAPPVSAAPLSSAAPASQAGLAVRDATFATTSAWLPAAETSEAKKGSAIGNLRPAGQPKASWTTKCYFGIASLITPR
jgi:hypothetical protein